MKPRRRIILTTALIVFLLSWLILNSIMEAAQGVGDAPLLFNPMLRSLWVALIVAGITAAGTYVLTKPE